MATAWWLAIETEHMANHELVGKLPPPALLLKVKGKLISVLGWPGEGLVLKYLSKLKHLAMHRTTTADM